MKKEWKKLMTHGPAAGGSEGGSGSPLGSVNLRYLQYIQYRRYLLQNSEHALHPCKQGAGGSKTPAAVTARPFFF